MTPVREGDLVAGKYRVERVLGVGGMGVVVAARHQELGQLVAIKFVREDTLTNDDAIERFLREARSAGRLKSEHVARVLDAGKLETGAPYMVMEYLEGDDLGRVLEDRGAMTPELAVQLVIQACDAVAEAHAAGIVHRDLKPQNLFLTHTIAGRPKLKVLDFGVSKASSLVTGGQGALTRTRSMLGSPLYMSPEQMRSAKDVDARADIWALGVVLYELLTRRWPFEAQSMPELCLKVVTDPPQRITAFRTDISPGLVAVIDRCLEKDPARRYADAGALALALEPFGSSSAARSAPSTLLLRDESSSQTVLPATVASAEVSSQTTPAPSAWDSTARRQASRRGWNDRTRTIVAAGSIAALVIVATAAALSRQRGAPAAAPAVNAKLATAPVVTERAPSPNATATEVKPSATAFPAVVLAPPPTPTSMEAAAAVQEAGAFRRPSVPHAAKPPPSSPGQARPAKADDDIPALR